MSTPPTRRSRKRQATREAISDVATRLFVEHGFDRVTIDEIAAAADVGRMTVFNHFPRKEDLFFDREDEVRELLRDAFRQRPAGQSPLLALHGLVRRLIADRSGLVEFSADSRAFVAAIEASEVLKARVRALRDDYAQTVAMALAEAADRPADDPPARLAGAMSLAGWGIALIEGHQAYRRTRKVKDAQSALLAMVDRCHAGVAAALAGTPYV